MGLPVKFLLCVLMLFSTLLHAQEVEFKYRVDGAFQRDPTVLNQTPVRFTLRWNEQGTNIMGVYSDNFFTDSSPVSGISGPEGRSFNVSFQSIIGGVRSLEIFLLPPGEVSGTVTVTITFKDPTGLPLGVYNVAGLMSLGPEPAPAAAPGKIQTSCVVGMGALTGYCGYYSGTIN